MCANPYLNTILVALSNHKGTILVLLDERFFLPWWLINSRNSWAMASFWTNTLLSKLILIPFSPASNLTSWLVYFQNIISKNSSSLASSWYETDLNWVIKANNFSYSSFCNKLKIILLTILLFNFYISSPICCILS